MFYSFVCLFVLFFGFFCFILFDASINRIVFLISFSNNLLLVCRNSTDFCVLILCPEALLNLFILTVFGSVFWVFYTLYVICKERQFNFFLSDLDAFYFFSLPHCSKIFYTVLKKRGIVGILILFLILQEKLRFSPLSMMLAVGFCIWKRYVFLLYKEHRCSFCIC